MEVIIFLIALYVLYAYGKKWGSWKSVGVATILWVVLDALLGGGHRHR
jgi:hypothetical protein